VDEIVHPEEETAERWSKKLCLNNVVDSFELNEDYSLIEAKVPKKLMGKSLGSINWREDYNIQVVTLIKKKEVSSVLGKTRLVSEIQGVVSDDWRLEENHILVLYGNNEDLNSFLGKD
jgi:trk system potassium uptake protein TrkA